MIVQIRNVEVQLEVDSLKQFVLVLQEKSLPHLVENEIQQEVMFHLQDIEPMIHMTFHSFLHYNSQKQKKQISTQYYQHSPWKWNSSSLNY